MVMVSAPMTVTASGASGNSDSDSPSPASDADAPGDVAGVEGGGDRGRPRNQRGRNNIGFVHAVSPKKGPQCFRTRRMSVYSTSPKSSQQPVMNISEAAVAEDTHYITRASTRTHMVHDGIDGRQIGGRLAREAKVLHELLRVESFTQRQLFQPSHLGYHYHVGSFQSIHQFLLEDIAARRVGTGLEHGPNAATGKLHP